MAIVALVTVTDLKLNDQVLLLQRFFVTLKLYLLIEAKKPHSVALQDRSCVLEVWWEEER